MAKTFNRRPVQVNTPSSNDVKNYFFNHYNWKGLTDNKNVLSVDQETFSDCKNVYVDSEGLLRSRPSLKVKVVKYGSNNYTLSNITNVWTFGNVIVYESFTDNLYYLTFVNNDFPDNAIQQSFSHNNYKLVLTDRKIFVFAEDGFYYYAVSKDTNLPTWYSGTDALSTIHIPVTSVIVNGVTTDAAPENKNLLTNSYITKYIFNSLANNDNFSIFVCDTVSIKIDGVVYGPIEFVENNNLVFVNKYFSLAENNFSDEYIYGDDGKGIPLVDFSDNGSVILSSYVKSQDNTYTWKIYYSTNNVIFEQLPYIDDVLVPAKITKDGNNAVVFLSDGPYIYSLTKYKYVNNVVVKEFDSWTNLLKYIDSDKYNSFGMKLGENNNKIINGEFVNSTDFTFSYASNYTGHGFSSLTNITCIDSKIDKRVMFGLSTTESTPVTGQTVDDLTFTSSSINNGMIIHGNSQYLERKFFYNTGSLVIKYSINCRFVYSENYTKLHVSFAGEVKDCTVPGVQNYSFSLIEDSYSNSFTGTSKVFDVTVKNVSNNINTKTFSATVIITPKTIQKEDEVLLDGHTVYSNNDVPICKMIVDKSTGTLSYRAVTLFTYHFYDNDNTKKFAKCVYSVTNGSIKSMTNNYENDSITSYCLLKYADVAISMYNIMYCYGINGITVYTFTDATSNVTFAEVIKRNKNFYCKISNVYNYIISDVGIFAYSNYPNNITYTYIPWLFKVKPIYYNEYPYVYDDTSVYSYFNKNIEVSKTTISSQNYVVPSHVSELSNFYFSNGSDLYISQNYITQDGKFEWYFPDITLQKFNYSITNLHPISNEIMSIFFNDEIWYVTFDNETQAYRYYKSKLQVGCKEGSDVITTFDGKYTIFSSHRGLVAMSYQDFIASDEQSLTYLSDTIYDNFAEYLNEPIKLHKYGFWLLVYKQNSKDGYVYDLRNNSWWPITGIGNNTKLVNIDNEVRLICNGKMYTLDKLDTNYFDYDGTKRIKIPWFVKSQKLHLNSINNYKHIVNITFVSVHDAKLLEQSNCNEENLDFKLQVNNYRKKVDGNINSDKDYVSVNYKIETVRTFVQRLNYSKINEFQYKLSSDEENAIEIPLSLNSITIKYKIGGQVR